MNDKYISKAYHVLIWLKKATHMVAYINKCPLYRYL